LDPHGLHAQGGVHGPDRQSEQRQCRVQGKSPGREAGAGKPGAQCDLGCPQRDALPHRVAASPASTLPTPASNATTSKITDTAVSEKEYLSRISGTWVIKVAKQSPCTKNPTNRATRARRRFRSGCDTARIVT
jgi:hypothetical protein